MSMYTPGTPPRGNPTQQTVRYPQKSPGPMNLRTSVDDLQPPGNSTVMDGRYSQQNLYSNSNVNPTQMGHYGMQGPVNVNQQGGMKMTDINALSSLLTNNRSNGIPMQSQQSGPQGPQTANVLGRVGGTGNVSQIPIGIGRGTTNMPVNGNMRMGNPNQIPQSVPSNSVPIGPNGSQPRPAMGRTMPQGQNVAPSTSQPQQPRIPMNQSINNPSGLRTGMQQPSTYNPSFPQGGNTMSANYTQTAISNLIDRTLQQNPNVPPSMVQGPGSPQKQDNLLSQLNEPSYDMAFPQLGVNSRSGVVNMSKSDMEFSLGAEDFPALPGFKGGSNEASSIAYSKPAQNLMGSSQSITGVGNYVQQDINRLNTPTGPNNMSQYEQFLQRQPQQKVIVPDRFGLLGLLSVIRMTDPDLNTLALGTDLTTLGLNLNSPDCLYNTFASPWSDGPSSSKREPEYYIPMCYYIPGPIQSPLAKMSLFSEETLFYIFYSMPRDVLQAASAAELYKREWRFHKEHKVWITRAPGTEPQKTASYERGSYVYFDVATWEKVRKDNFVLSYDQLETSPPHVDTVNKTN